MVLSCECRTVDSVGTLKIVVATRLCNSTLKAFCIFIWEFIFNIYIVPL